MKNSFEARIENLVRDPRHCDFADALIAVCDTAESVQLWFEAKGVSYTATDLVALTRMVLEERNNASAASSKGAA